MIAPRIESVRVRLLADHRALIAELERAARQMRRRTDERAVHDVRVAIRRLESALDLLKPLTRPRARRRARRALRSLRRSLAPARDVRITLQLLADRQAGFPPAARVLSQQLEERLGSRLHVLERRAARRCARAEIDRVRRRFERVWREPPFAEVADPALLEPAHARLTRRAARAVAALERATAEAEPGALHDARIQAKRWRYALERHAAATADSDRSDQRWLKQIQDALGEIQDFTILRERVKRLSGQSAGRASDAAALRLLLESCETDRDRAVLEFRRLAITRDHGRQPPPPAVAPFQRF